MTQSPRPPFVFRHKATEMKLLLLYLFLPLFLPAQYRVSRGKFIQVSRI